MMDARSAFGPRAATLCGQFAIDVPIVQAPMAGGWTTPALAAAVANAGGLGMLAAARLSVDQLRRDIEATRALTTRRFGVNFLIAPPETFDGDADRMHAVLNPLRRELGLPDRDDRLPTALPSVIDAQIDVVVETGVPIVSFALGNPARYVSRLHAAGAIVVAAATCVDEARALEQAGIDVIVAQGAEAGGHRSTFDVHAGALPLVGTMVLVPCVADAVSVPVVASGGIVDGRGLAAALALGASAVQMGTRFLASHESGAYAAYREKLLQTPETGTVVTADYTGRPARSLPNRFIETVDRGGVGPLPWPFQSLAAEDVFRAGVAAGSAEYSPVLAGQGTPLLRADLPSAEIVRSVAADARAALAGLGH
jgi:nitronate monooxygenase